MLNSDMYAEFFYHAGIWRNRGI